MTIRRKPAVALCATAAFLVGLAALAFGSPASTAAQQPQLAEDYFLNVQDMRGVPVDEFIDTMGMISAALSLNCTDCHTPESSSSWEAFADETPLKRTTRRMIQMVGTINEENFGGQPFVSCWTCHRGDLRPKVVPNLAVQYGVPLLDPNEVMFIPDPYLPAPEEVFAKYIGAIGGTDALNALTSFVATGSYEGFDTGFSPVPVTIYSASPNRRTVVVEPLAGDSVRVFNGSQGWIAATDRAMPLLPLTGSNLDGAEVEAVQGFPAGLQEIRDRWEVGFTIIEGQDIQVVQGNSSGQTPVNLYFDDSGLLVRLLRFSDTPIGRIPIQIDFSDYREVAGVRMPFRWTSTWTNGQATFQLDEVRPNVPIDSSRFNQPAPAEFRENL